MTAPVLSALRGSAARGLWRPGRLPAVIAMIALAVGATLGAAEARGEPRILVLGDSISAAYGMSLEQGWVALLARRLKSRWPASEVINASISGDTSAGGLRRLPPLLARHAPSLVVLELGGNDGLRGYPTPRLRDNLTAMARLARAAGSAVLILPMEIPPNYGPRYTRAFRASFTQAAEAAASTLGPFPLDGIATQRALMQDDGIHPSIEAQPMIADLLEPVILKLLDAL